MYVTGVNMASLVEDNKLECKANEMNDQEINIKNIYEKCEQILNNDKETFQNKAESLVDAWKQLRLCGTTAKIQHVIHLLDWAKLHTLNIVLSGDWKKYKDTFETKLLNEVEICERELHKVNNSFSLHCKKLAKVIQDPWGNATLCKLLNTADPVITRVEFDFFIGESGYLVSMRLKKLCESHCEDLALNLVTAYMRCCEYAELNKFNMNLTEDQKRFMLDVYIALLYKYKKTPVILTTLKLLSLKEGLELVKRFAKKRVEISKLWRHSNRITHLAAVLFASAAIIQPYDDSASVLTELVDVWLSLSDREESLESLITSIRRVIQVATSACHMYIFCEAIYKKFGQRMKTFNIELYIQALTTDLNCLERQKAEVNKIEVTETSQRLAHGFLRLADVLDEHLNVSRECVLTSFSLKPTIESLLKIEEMAKRCGYEVLDTGQWKCKMHPPVQPSDELCTQCSECGDFMSPMQLEGAINTNVALNEALTAERLGLSPELCDDLVVVVCSPRYQLLSWLQKWPQLHRLCIMYLNDPERTKNLVTELKFLDIDYSIFMNIKREPEDEQEEEELYGYGYEDIMEKEFYSDPHLSITKKPRKKPGRKKSIKPIEESPPDVFVPPRASTDPNVLKSLRSFRRNLKRPREGEDNVLPNKLFISSDACNSVHLDNHSNAIPTLAQTSVCSYYNSVNYDYYGNVNSSANNGYYNSYEHNGYYYPYYNNSELGNTNNSYNYSYKCSQNFSDLNSVDYKIKLGTKQPANRDNSTIVKEDLKASTTSDLSKDCSINYPEDCSTPVVHKEPSVLKQLLHTQPKSVLVNNLSSSLNEQLLKSISSKQKHESSGLHIMENNAKSDSTQNINSSSNNNKTIMEQPSESTLQNVIQSQSSENRDGLLKQMTKTQLELHNMLKARQNAQIKKEVSNKPTVHTLNSNQISGNKLANPSCSKNNLSSIFVNVQDNISANTIVERRQNFIENDSPQQYSNYCSQNENSFKNFPSDTRLDAEDSNFTSIPDVEASNSNENIFSEPPVEPNERISCTDEKVPPWLEEEKDTHSKDLFFPVGDKISRLNIEDSSSKSNFNNTCIENDIRNSDDSSNVSNESTSNGSNISDTSSNDISFISLNHSKNLDETCSRIEKNCTNNILNKTKPTSLKTELCALELLTALQDSEISNDELTEQFPYDIDGSGLKKCVDCGENVWDEIARIVTAPSNTKEENAENVELLKELQRRLGNQHCEKTKENSKAEENDITHILKEKYKLKELRVVLKRFNVQPINKTHSKLKEDAQKKTDLNVQFINSKNKQKAKKNNRRNNKRSENKSKVQSPSLYKDEYKNRTWPLQDINPRVVCDNKSKPDRIEKSDKFDKPERHKPRSDKLDDKRETNKNDNKKPDKDSGRIEDHVEKIPRVMLKRLDVHAILANVPGMHDTEMIRPSNVDSIVQVVQVAGGRPTPTSPNNQTSTQVTPHIQRIGQPRNEKPDPAIAETSSSSINTKSSTTAVTTKPATSQPSTLINILSQQIIRPGPGQSNSRPRSGPFINILSQQIVRPANTSVATVKTVDTQSNSNITRIVSTGESQVINQLVSPIRTTGTTLKTVVTNPGADQSRIVQLICKSADGKLIPVTSFTPNRVVKIATTQNVTSSTPTSSPNFDENITKLVQVSPKSKSDIENSESLPKFQQAFGKTVYQNNVDSTNTTVTNSVVNNVDDKIKTQPKTTSVNVQPIQGGVIYTRQVPVGQAINLIPPSRGQVFRIATSNAEQISLVKDTTVIHNKMSALLAAALQGKQKNSDTVEVDSSAETNTTQANARVTLARPTLVHNARIVKPVLQIPSNVIRNTPQPNLSSTTLEQLREFDMVYKQVKERSSTSTPSDSLVTTETTEASQRISVTYLNQPPKVNCSPVMVVSSYNSLQPAASPALSVASQGSSSPCVTPAPTPTPVLPKVATKSSKGKSVKNATLHASKSSPVPKPQQKPQEDEHTTQRIFDILAEYAEQLRNSPDLNNKPAPRRRSNPPTNPSQNSKRKKSSGSKKSGQCSSTLTSEADLEDPRTIGSEDSSCGIVQVSMQEEDSTPVTANASESNDATVQPRQQLILTESTNQTRNLIIADSSVGDALKMPSTAVLVPGNYIMPVSMVKGGQQIAVVSGGSKILATVPARSGPNMLLFQSFLNQNRKTSVPTVKYSTIQPLAGISPQNLSVSTQQPVILQQPTSHGISTVTLSQPLPIKKIDEPDRVNTELLLTISQTRDSENSPNDEIPQPDSSTSVVSANIESIDLEESATLSDTSSEKTYTYQKPLVTAPIATPVIAQTNSKEEMTVTCNKGTSGSKAEERVQSVLVTAGTSNGPMLSHSPPRFTKQNDCPGPTEQNKDDYLRNGGKRNSGPETKNFPTNNLYTIHGKIKKVQTNSQKIDRELQQLCLQRKQAALERELRLQKSLSEECEDLGVDEPSTSDLFPEADLLFDSNHSPSFDQTSQDIVKRPINCQEVKEETKLTLFSDDDFLFEPGEYQTTETELEYDQARLLTNGQSSTGSGSPCADNTLLQTCTSMSDVTLNSPISPDTYNATTPPPLNKYIHKYSNRKKDKLKQVENWPVDVSSSEDTTGSTELIKSSSRSPELCVNKRSDEELSENNFKVVRVAISKTECDEIHCSEDADCSISGRGARRSVKKMCSCCNGSQDAAASRKRPASQPHTPTPHKKTFLSKKR